MIHSLPHQIKGNDVAVSCGCGWYNHDPRDGLDKSATAHILREVAHYPELADRYEVAYRRMFDVPKLVR